MNQAEKLQKVIMCIQTYHNMYGIMPGIKDMTDWLGASYEALLYVYLK